MEPETYKIMCRALVEKVAADYNVENRRAELAKAIERANKRTAAFETACKAWADENVGDR